MRERWRSGLVFVISTALFVGIVLFAPGSETSAFRRLLGLSDGPDGGEYAFLSHQPGDEDDPVTWDPCQQIHYEINPDGAPGSAEETRAFVEEAVARVAAVTGLQFAYDGRTDRRPSIEEEPGPGDSRGEPVLIAWATEDEVDDLEGDVAGIGGPTSRGGLVGRLRYVSGNVVLDIDSYDDVKDEGARAAYQRAVLLHELGHVVGLDHVDSRSELMFADHVGQVDFGPGDLKGLARLGKGSCA